MLTVCVHMYLCVCVQEATSANGVSVYLQFLRDEFLPYLKAWEDSVHSREGFTANEKKMMMISQETLNGIRITGRLLSKVPLYCCYRRPVCDAADAQKC